MTATDEIALDWLRRDLSDLSLYDVIDDSAGVLPRIAEIVRANSISGRRDDRRADLRVRLTDGSERTIRVWAYGNADGSGITVEVIR